jgi:hypothetical protein
VEDRSGARVVGLFLALSFLGLNGIPVWDRSLHTLLGVAFFAAIAGAGAAVMKLYTSVVTSTWTRRLGSGWNQPTNLNGWVPRSSAQIATAESIAEHHGGGQAYVYDQGVPPLVVRACRWFHTNSWFVEDDGSSTKQARFYAADGPGDSRESS